MSVRVVRPGPLCAIIGHPRAVKKRHASPDAATLALLTHQLGGEPGADPLAFARRAARFDRRSCSDRQICRSYFKGLFGPRLVKPRGFARCYRMPDAVNTGRHRIQSAIARPKVYFFASFSSWACISAICLRSSSSPSSATGGDFGAGAGGGDAAASDRDGGA